MGGAPVPGGPAAQEGVRVVGDKGAGDAWEWGEGDVRAPGMGEDEDMGRDTGWDTGHHLLS